MTPTDKILEKVEPRKNGEIRLADIRYAVRAFAKPPDRCIVREGEKFRLLEYGESLDGDVDFDDYAFVSERDLRDWLASGSSLEDIFYECQD